MGAPLIEVRGLVTRFGATVVHDGLDLDIGQGDILALVGGSGAGKTTLLRALLGLETPAAGSIRVFGREVVDADDEALAQLRRRWGMLFQHGALFSALNVFDNVAQPMRELRALPEDLVRDAVLLKLDMVGLTPADALKMPADLSGGMVKRAALARALALEPELLFLDEPTAGLDPSLTDSFVALVKSLHQAMCLTVVMVTHDVEMLLALATRIAVLADRRVVVAGSADAVRAHPHPFVQAYFHQHAQH